MSPEVSAKVTPLYTPHQIFVASALGSPAAAAWLISRNYLTLSRPEKVHEIYLLGGIATVIALVIAFLLPEKTPHLAWPIAYSLPIYYYASRLFGVDLEKHIAEGGTKGSWWRVIGVALLFCIVVLGLLFVAVVLFPSVFE